MSLLCHVACVRLGVNPGIRYENPGMAPAAATALGAGGPRPSSHQGTFAESFLSIVT
jgi:hypothetical protein